MTATDRAAHRPFRILIVDDEPGIRCMLEESLQRLGCHVVQARDGSEGLERIEETHLDLAFVDIRMPRIDGLEVTRRAKRLRPDLHVVVMTGYASIQVAVDAVKQGADDFLPKPFLIDQLRVIPDTLLALRDGAGRDHALGEPGRDGEALPGLVGTSPALRAVYRAVRRVAPTDETVLIQGESGTGKELAARAIHFWSRRHSKPFVPVNCSSVAEGVLLNELFGHEREAFTGAERQRKGLVEKAHGGTLFLDEIGDAPPTLQMALLRFLQQSEVRRLGSAEPIAVDVRVIAATNKSLERAISQGTFRKDLYYRLNVVPIDMPPLRDRPGDVPLLLDHFLHRYEDPDRAFAPDAVRALQRCRWHGNVRELENLVRRLLVLVPDSEVRRDHLPPQYREAPPPHTIDSGTFREAKEIFERQYLEALLQRVRGNVSEAARLAGLGRTYFHEKMRRFGINPTAYREQQPGIS